MVIYPAELDFGPFGQILVRKGKHWDVMYLSSFREAKKQRFGLVTLFYSVDEWRAIKD